MSTEAKTQVEKILENSGVTFTAEYDGTTRLPGWDSDAHAFTCNFRDTLTLTDGQCRDYGMPFYMGLGHKGKDEPPHAADVLSSLILDAGSAGSSFEDWCADLGYDSDSRKKAYRIYEACGEVDRKLRAFFSPEALQALRDALQDY